MQAWYACLRRFTIVCREVKQKSGHSRLPNRSKQPEVRRLITLSTVNVYSANLVQASVYSWLYRTALAHCISLLIICVIFPASSLPIQMHHTLPSLYGALQQSLQEFELQLHACIALFMSAPSFLFLQPSNTLDQAKYCTGHRISLLSPDKRQLPINESTRMTGVLCAELPEKKGCREGCQAAEVVSCNTLAGRFHRADL